MWGIDASRLLRRGMGVTLILDGFCALSGIVVVTKGEVERRRHPKYIIYIGIINSLICEHIYICSTFSSIFFIFYARITNKFGIFNCNSLYENIFQQTSGVGSYKNQKTVIKIAKKCKN